MRNIGDVGLVARGRTPRGMLGSGVGDRHVGGWYAMAIKLLLLDHRRLDIMLLLVVYNLNRPWMRQDQPVWRDCTTRK